MTLTGTSYGMVVVGEGATVVFTESDVSLRGLRVMKNGTVEFSGCSFLRVYYKAYLHKNSTFNPQGYKVWMFVQCGKVDIKEGVTFNGSIYSKGYEIKAKGKHNNPTYMNGMFISYKVKGDRNVIWNWDANCDSSCPPIPSSKNNVPWEDNMDLLTFEVIAYPNPYVETFTIALDSDLEGDMDIYVHNMNGQVVEKYEGVSSLEAPDMGRDLPAGMYFVTVTQSGFRKTVKVNKLR
jgi:hypothetical protein